MTDAPERINLTGTVANGLYVRKDLHDAALARVAELEAEKARLWAGVIGIGEVLLGLSADETNAAIIEALSAP